MFIGIFLACIFLRVKIKRLFFYSLLTSLLLAIIFILNPSVKERVIDRTYHSIFYSHDLDFNYTKKINLFSQGHQDHFKSALLMFKKNYLIGVGVRNFRNECKKVLYKEVGIYGCTSHPHNTYLQLLSETGLIGFSFFIIFLSFVSASAFKYLLNISKNHEAIDINRSLCFVIILVNFFPLTTTGSFFNNWLSTLYFMPIPFFLHELSYKKY